MRTARGAARMARFTKPIGSKTKGRYAELIGLGLSHPEAAGADRHLGAFG